MTMLKQIISLLCVFCLVGGATVTPVFAETTALSSEQQNAIAMLNDMTFLTTETNAAKNSRVFMEQAYSSLVNNDEQAHWPIRQKILLNTIRAKLFSKVESPISWFPWLSDKVYGNGNEKQCEAFAVLVYCVHILGDHIEAEKHTALAYVAPLSNSHDSNNPGIIPELMKYLNAMHTQIL